MVFESLGIQNNCEYGYHKSSYSDYSLLSSSTSIFRAEARHCLLCIAGGIALVSGSPQAAPRIIPCRILTSVAYSEKSPAMSRSFRHDPSLVALYSPEAMSRVQTQASMHAGRLSHGLRACILILCHHGGRILQRFLFDTKSRSTNISACPFSAPCALSNTTYHCHLIFQPRLWIAFFTAIRLLLWEPPDNDKRTIPVWMVVSLTLLPTSFWSYICETVCLFVCVVGGQP
jgi:hypothetical protein